MRPRCLMLLSCASLALSGCRDVADIPTSTLAPSSTPHRSIVLSSPPPQWRYYWRTDSSLFVYDASIEIGMIAQPMDNGDYSAIKSLGMRFVVAPAYWNYWIANHDESGAPGYRHAVVDGAVRAKQQGLQLMLVLVDGDCNKVPTCVRESSQWGASARQAFANWTAEVADSIQMADSTAAVKYFVIWNEPDAGNTADGLLSTPPGGCPNRSADGQAYADLLARTKAALAARHSNIWLLAAGFTGTEKWVNNVCNGPIDYTRVSWDFLNGMYSNGGQQYFDILALHAYGYSVADPTLGFHALSLNFNNQISALDPGRPIWMTETGTDDANTAHGGVVLDSFPRSQWDAVDTGLFDTRQRTYIDDAWHNYIWDNVLSKMFVYDIRGGGWCQIRDTRTGQIVYGPDTANGLPNRDLPRCLDQEFGIMTNDFTPRPAYNLLNDLEHTQGDFLASNSIDANGGRTAPVTITPRDCHWVPSGYSWSYNGDGSVTIQNVTVMTVMPTIVRFTWRSICPNVQ